ncbi:hypothetical protein ABIA40_000113 [Bradyrhizobium sp. USDA 223]
MEFHFQFRRIAASHNSVVARRWRCGRRTCFQYFTGEEFFQHASPHERWGPEPLAQAADKLEVLQANSLRVAHEDGTLSNQDLRRVTVDTTVQRRPSPSPPTKLLPPGIKGISRLANKPGVKLRQSYLGITNTAAMMASGYALASNSSGITASCASCAAGWAGSSARSAARSKVSLRSRTRSPFCLEGPRKFARSGSASATAAAFFPRLGREVPRRWRGASAPDISVHPRRAFISGQKHGVFGIIKRELRRPSAIEPVIGQLKADGHLGRCYLKGRAVGADNHPLRRRPQLPPHPHLAEHSLAHHHHCCPQRPSSLKTAS